MPVELTIAAVRPEDAGRGVARVDRSVLDDLGVEPGGVVSVRGRRTTVARALPAYPDDSPGLVRVDGTTRSNAKAAIDEKVTVEPVTAEPAERVVLAPPPGLSLTGGEAFAKNSLRDRPLVRGDAVRFNLLGNPLVFFATNTKPTGPILVTAETEVVIRAEPVSDADLEYDWTTTPEISYEDIGGLDHELEQVREIVELPLRHPELFQRLGISAPRGVLLYGPPGTGKTLIARAVANEVDANFVDISGPEIMSKFYGESEEHLREVFEEASANAPTIVFIDEIDSIAPPRDEVSGEVERRVVAQLLSLMDGLEDRGDVIVIAATNRPDGIDPALRRPGRFDREIEVGVPDREGRRTILDIHTRAMPLTEDVDLDGVADRTHGFVGADIEALAKEAAMNALRRVRPELDLDAPEIPADVLANITVTGDDVEAAIQVVSPSAMRELFVEVPDVTWDDVGGLDDVRTELTRAVEWPLTYPEAFDRLRTHPPRGVLLYGPPGTGKTLVAKAVANASGVNFISVKGPELLDKYVGESEKAVRDLFAKARQNAPTIVFIDELDAVAPQRGQSFDSGVTERVVSQLLTELDGVEELDGVVVLAATNRPDIVDSALLRPGRLDKAIHVPVPDREARRRILDIHTEGVPLADDVDLDALLDRTDGFTGSDIEALVREASMVAMDDYVAGGATGVDSLTVTADHFDAALDDVHASVTAEAREWYGHLADQLSAALPKNRPALEDVSFE
ncbi:CDC48 family AAA ATPase [Halocalculus aciditolerans]|uniref:ATPase AAA n=1 Tax=Halocalculus aciditolerans TaxID=1383812 RepID=A0A830F9E7_9EURY|nr:CDC48 family AAA ATPase [Halocalculus aciditolerans]GGL52177.1 ATPase AAA [Halocalculus aciditolerans]